MPWFTEEVVQAQVKKQVFFGVTKTPYSRGKQFSCISESILLIDFLHESEHFVVVCTEWGQCNFLGM